MDLPDLVPPLPLRVGGEHGGVDAGQRAEVAAEALGDGGIGDRPFDEKVTRGQPAGGGGEENEVQAASQKAVLCLISAELPPSPQTLRSAQIFQHVCSCHLS